MEKATRQTRPFNGEFAMWELQATNAAEKRQQRAQMMHLQMPYNAL